MSDDLLSIYNVNYKFNDNYNLVYLEHNTYESLNQSVSTLRKSGELDSYQCSVVKKFFKHYYNNSLKIKYLDSIQPRLIAQKFIGKKKVRDFIFNRDNNACLKCGSHHRLELDHIIPISRGGENKLSNLQTLCKTCNISKSNNFKDYRNGAR